MKIVKDDTDMSPENIRRPISSESEEDHCSDDEAENDIQHGTWTKAGTERPHFPFIGKPGLNVKITNSENQLQFFKVFLFQK
jgi:hypothetical protein